MIIIFIAIFAVSGFLLGFGDAGRGTWSQYVSIIAGLVWLGGVVLAFLNQGLIFGILAVLGSFILAGVTMNIGKWAVHKISKLVH